MAGFSGQRPGESFAFVQRLRAGQSSGPKYRAFSPRELRLTAKSKDLFEELRCHDILLHHPFDSYDAVVSFIESAAEDDNVLSIKQTLYRTSEHSLIVPSLIDAASRKEVTAVVELKARFDEASNIRWARDWKMRECKCSTAWSA